jgi:tartrate dehydratase beta subunit/fumarate hydratase class I family protein
MCDDDSSDDNSEDDCVDHNGHEDGNREYICGVAGPGNSTRLEITNNELQAKQEGVKMLCMTKHACEVIAAQAFPGAHAEARGYCRVDSNKNVKHISDEHLIPLVNKWLASH